MRRKNKEKTKDKNEEKRHGRGEEKQKEKPEKNEKIRQKEGEKSENKETSTDFSQFFIYKTIPLQKKHKKIYNLSIKRSILCGIT